MPTLRICSPACCFVNPSLDVQRPGNFIRPQSFQGEKHIHGINHYSLDNSIGFASVYPLDSDLSGG